MACLVAELCERRPTVKAKVDEESGGVDVDNSDELGLLPTGRATLSTDTPPPMFVPLQGQAVPALSRAPSAPLERADSHLKALQAFVPSGNQPRSTVVFAPQQSPAAAVDVDSGMSSWLSGGLRGRGSGAPGTALFGKLPDLSALGSYAVVFSSASGVDRQLPGSPLFRSRSSAGSGDIIISAGFGGGGSGGGGGGDDDSNNNCGAGGLHLLSGAAVSSVPPPGSPKRE